MGQEQKSADSRSRRTADWRILCCLFRSLSFRNGTMRINATELRDVLISVIFGAGGALAILALLYSLNL